MFDTAEETHGDGIGITNGKKVFALMLDIQGDSYTIKEDQCFRL